MFAKMKKWKFPVAEKWEIKYTKRFGNVDGGSINNCYYY